MAAGTKANHNLMHIARFKDLGTTSSVVAAAPCQRTLATQVDTLSDSCFRECADAPTVPIPLEGRHVIQSSN